MPLDLIDCNKSNYYTSFILDYLNENEKIKSLYNLFPNIENFKKQVQLKSENYNHSFRTTLVTELHKQYEEISISDKTKSNLELLKNNNSFTVTTGHQLNLFTGPLYFLYKIISTIKTCEILKNKYPNQNFIPIYWMATEDHDFEEINHFNFGEKKIIWNKNAKGAVGKLSLDGLEKVFDEFKNLNISTNHKKLSDLFYKSYLVHNNLADATRYLVNELFGKYGLVIIDGNSKILKQELISTVKNDIFKNFTHSIVNDTNTLIANAGYKTQVNPREINFFYLKPNLRERIVLENELFKINNTDITFTKEQLEIEIENYPERFSPNVLLRPLYQEIILPNLSYVGGGGEIAYWLQLKNVFENSKITFPILQIRNSILLLNNKQLKNIDKLNLAFENLVQNKSIVIEKIIKNNSKEKFDFSKQIDFLKLQFNSLKEVAKSTDISFLKAVNAQEIKQIKGLLSLEKKLNKAEKKKNELKIQQIEYLYNSLSSNNSLQERYTNFSFFYDINFLEKLFLEINPFTQKIYLLNI